MAGVVGNDRVVKGDIERKSMLDKSERVSDTQNRRNKAYQCICS